ncbi:hypothetical protein [Sphingobacterium suaedae]|uniref:N-acetyltransferase n=1 Tax=Sphingobacterium suaedae TaxID=1686402 RepID=A0ABW5KG38_9SPHI
MPDLDSLKHFGNDAFFTSEIILENNQVFMRPLAIDDLQSLVDISFSDRLWEYGHRVKSEEDVKGYIQTCLSWRAESAIIHS